jgi:hypothetical protein
VAARRLGLLDGTAGELALCFLAAGAANGAIEAAEHVGVAQVAPVPLRWSAFGSLSAVRSFGRLTATVGATVVWTVLGPEWGLLLATPLMAMAVIVMTCGATDSAAGPTWRIVRALVLALLPAAVALLLVATGGIRSYP